MKLNDLGYKLVKSSAISKLLIYEEWVKQVGGINFHIYLNTRGYVYKYTLVDFIENKAKMNKIEKRAAMDRIEELKESLS